MRRVVERITGRRGSKPLKVAFMLCSLDSGSISLPTSTGVKAELCFDIFKLFKFGQLDKGLKLLEKSCILDWLLAKWRI